MALCESKHVAANFFNSQTLCLTAVYYQLHIKAPLVQPVSHVTVIMNTFHSLHLMSTSKNKYISLSLRDVFFFSLASKREGVSFHTLLPYDMCLVQLLLQTGTFD